MVMPYVKHVKMKCISLYIWRGHEWVIADHNIITYYCIKISSLINETCYLWSISRYVFFNYAVAQCAKVRRKDVKKTSISDVEDRSESGRNGQARLRLFSTSDRRLFPMPDWRHFLKSDQRLSTRSNGRLFLTSNGRLLTNVQPTTTIDVKTTLIFDVDKTSISDIENRLEVVEMERPVYVFFRRRIDVCFQRRFDVFSDVFSEVFSDDGWMFFLDVQPTTTIDIETTSVKCQNSMPNVVNRSDVAKM